MSSARWERCRFSPPRTWGLGVTRGLIVTQDDALAERLARPRLHGGSRQYLHEEVGTNSRLDYASGRRSPGQAAPSPGME